MRKKYREVRDELDFSFFLLLFDCWADGKTKKRRLVLDKEDGD